MRSTFMGLETARRGMFTQQSALHTTSHNIANANTPGYTRQRINFEQTEPYPNAALNRPQIPGQVGTGVKAGSIQRIRESFLDVQYRGENNKLGYWETRAESYRKLEEVLNEPSDAGLSKTMDQFWQALQDLAVNPTNPGARSVVRQRGIAVAETFNYLHQSLSSIQRDLKNEVSVTEKEINSITNQLSRINSQIADVEPHGYLPNDLYDERDRLIDQLASHVNIKVDYTGSGGGSLKIAEGQAVVKMVSDSGKELGILVSGDRNNELKVNFDGEDETVKTVTLGNTKFNFTDLNSTGKLKALVESYGYEKLGVINGVYPGMLAELDNLAYTFASEFNSIHAGGVGPNEISKSSNDDIPFFSGALTADVAFVIDNTGSMGGPITNVKENINDFVKSLADFNISANLGLVTYGEKGEPGGDPVKNQLTTDVTQFINNINSITLSGGGDTPESGLEGIMDPANGAISYSTNESNLKHIIFVTDAPVHDASTGKSIYEIQEVAKELEAKGIRLHVVSTLGNDQLKELSDPTKGLFVDINSPNFGGELLKVASSISNDLGNRKGYAGRISVSQPIMDSLDNIATASAGSPYVGDSENILKLANVMNNKFDYGNDSEMANFRNYYEGVIGGMAVLSQEAVRLTQNSGSLREAVDERRKSVSSVSLDEEMTNMIQFQHAYNASARMITLQDEMLDKIINGMGTVGR